MQMCAHTKKVLLAMLMATTLAGCNSGSGNNGSVAAKIDENPAKYYVFAVDHEGYVNIYSDDGGLGIEKSSQSFQPKNKQGGALSLGEIHFVKGKAVLVVQNGFTDDAGTAIGGGIIIVDVATQALEYMIPLQSSNGLVTRLVHSYLDPDGQHLWINNDGPNGSSGLTVEEIAMADSVFRVNVDHEDTMDLDADGLGDDIYIGAFVDADAGHNNNANEIIVGNGHKKSTFTGSDAGGMAMKYFMTHNMTDKTVSVIDNDPAAASFLTVVKTISLGDSAPHGMDFSHHSGHVYTGLVSGSNAVNIIDATDMTLPAGNIAAGTDAGQIPAGGYVHTHDDWVYTAGYKNGVGYLSVIDAATDTVLEVIDLGNISSSSFNISHMSMTHGTMTHEMLKVYVPSRTSGTAENDKIAVVELDMTTGMRKADVAVKHIPVGAGSDHRNGKITPDGMHAYYPNGGDCGVDHASHGPNCTTISVINTMTDEVIAILNTEGHEPGSIGIVEATGNESMTGDPGHEHMH